MELLIILFLVGGAIAGYNDVYKWEWESWKAEHQKSYADPLEERVRFKIFLENKVRIANHNKAAHSSNTGFSLKMNSLGDQQYREVVSERNGFKKGLLKNQTRGGIKYLGSISGDLPKSVDWRTLGAVTEVKDQGSCGSCWSFSATGALEGQHFRKTGKLVSLSEQNLIDCSTKFGNHGCQGGLMDFAFKYVKANGGIDTEKSYPYEAHVEKCRFNKDNIGASDVGYVDIPEGSESQLMHAVATMGPIAVAIDASPSSFQFYNEGIYEEPGCSPTDLDHGVLLVGYGSENGRDYWIIKNSWGPRWGEKGSMKMARNKNNMCGIATMASFPLV